MSRHKFNPNSPVAINLLKDPNYSPYCGDNTCFEIPRTRFIKDTGQFYCPTCGWMSSIPKEFADKVKAFREANTSNPKPSPKSQPIEDLLTSLNGGVSRQEANSKVMCTICREPVGPFKDHLSSKEYSISGMCQKCQDSFFG